MTVAASWGRAFDKESRAFVTRCFTKRGSHSQLASPGTGGLALFEKDCSKALRARQVSGNVEIFEKLSESLVNNGS